ncbi:hypothetical protein Val02_08260 [Virgisporangium aliadipatigenens]|uniref:Sensor-like histidine kinase SenX3 n=1 Tax=Virgisporangium aliadipatigenens TaxID=741659 RepID=A0A8J3YH54_9ACTN|nr:ATP-binding protein [Virgisporangium aliadipatigenens]GIJ43940.1 hypothetical protein Val02_08260 [Virgisporangium aliadipatigenens]
MGARWRDGVRPVIVYPLLLAVAGVAASGAVGAVLRDSQERTTDTAMIRRTAEIQAAVASEVRRYEDTLTTLATATGALERLDTTRFADVTAAMDDLRLAGAISALFVVADTTATMPDVQREWRQRGATGLVLDGGGAGPEHLHVVLERLIDPTVTLSVRGFDFSRYPPVAAALTEARGTGTPAASETFLLPDDPLRPNGPAQRAFVLAAPVRGPPEGAFLGWILMGVRGEDFIGSVLRRAGQGLLDVTVWARTVEGGDAVVAVHEPGSGTPRDLRRVVDLDVAHRRWRLEARASAAEIPGGANALPAAVSAAGLVLTLLLCLLVYVLGTGRARARAQVHEATGALRDELIRRRAAEAGVAAQKDYLTQVLDAIDVAVLTCDPDGTIVHANRRARDFLPADPGRRSVDSLLPGLVPTAADGTPLPPAELPLARALRGEPVVGAEALLTRPDGSREVMLMHARPLFAGDETIIGAVASGYGITELRAREAELAAFAAVVAHDLQSPLTTVRGYADLVRTRLTDNPEMAAHVHDLDTVIRTSRRMSTLISDLLAFTSAGDSAVHPRTVALSALVEEVIQDRLAAVAVDPYTPVPRFDVGPLPAVEADPSLVHQLLDNVIGNAVKYTPPGQPARIEITGRDDGAGLVHVAIADRGIGIPAGQHDAVFTGFRRAHPKSGYTGTGLGLAICQRVVERHGGTIAAHDNPGGGTVIRFTLPAAVRTSAVPRSGQAVSAG